MKSTSTSKFWSTTLCSILLLFSEIHGDSSSNIFNIIRQADIMNSSSHPNLSEIIDAVPQKKHDYVLKLNCVLKNEEIVSYLRDLTYHHHKMFNITADDLIQLSGIEKYDLNKSIELLHKMNLSDEIISFESFKEVLDISNLTFAEFYEKLKERTNLNGQSLQNALNMLNINPSEFSNTLTFGGSQAAVYAILEKGVFTEEKLGQAAAAVGTDLSTFYNNVKAIILERMKMKEMSYYVEKLGTKSWANQELFNKVWDSLELQTENVYEVVDFRRIIDNIFERVNANVSLGVAIAQHEIVIHKRVYKNYENYQRILILYAESLLYPGKIYENLTVTKLPNNDSYYAKLWTNSSIFTTIDTMNRMTALNASPNCTYISLNETELVEIPVKFVNFSNGFILVEPVNGSNFNIGYPLICDGKLAGLASKYENDRNLFAFDTFFQKSENGTGTDSSGSMKNGESYTMIFSILLFFMGVLLIQDFDDF